MPALYSLLALLNDKPRGIPFSSMIRLCRHDTSRSSESYFATASQLRIIWTGIRAAQRRPDIIFTTVRCWH
jgi:hypothetical protein